MNKRNVAVIGAGRIGRIHANKLSSLKQVNLMAISDVYEENALKLANDLCVEIVEKDYKKILENDKIDAVIICSPTNTHAQIIIDAANAGKHIFCEKPIALELEKIDMALEAVKKAGVFLEIGFNRRFDPSFKKARDMIAKGEIGEPHLVRITSRDPEPPSIDYVKNSGGLFLDMSIHDFDMARYLLGEEVTEVMAAGNCLIDPAIGEVGDIDTAIITFKYENGALGAIDNSRKAVYGYDNRIEVFGTEGSIAVGHKKPTEIVVNKKEGIIGEKPLYFFLERYEEAYQAEMEDFIAVINDSKNPLADGKDGKIAVQIAYAANKSLKKGCFVSVNL